MKYLYPPFLFLLVLLGATTAKAQFLYNMPITVTNHVNSTVLRWQVPLYINTAIPVTAGHMQTDGRDIRFSKDCAGTQMLDFFIDSGMNSAKTKIWVKIDTLYPLADRVIYMLYGNTTVTAGSSYATFNGPYSATNQVVPPSTNTVSDCQRGMKFRATRDIIVSRFGKFTPDATTRWVTLFDFNTQAKLEQIQVAGPAVNYSYQSLPKHTWIKNNVDYILTLHNGTGDMYYYGATATTTPYITYGDMRYCNSCNQNTFPTTVLTNNMYGIPDFEYYTVDTNNISTAPTYILSGGGSGGNAELSLGNMPIICPGVTQALIPYSVITGNPQSYSISWNPAALGAGFTDVTNDPLSAGDIAIVVPASAATGTYSGTLRPINVCGPGKSYTIQITVGGPVTVDAGGQPNDTTVCPRDPSSFTVKAKGPALSYQWQLLSVSSVWTDIVNGGDYANATTPQLTIIESQNAYNGNQYRCVVKSDCSPSVSSTPGKLIVNVDPVVSTDPQDVTANPGQTVTFTIANSGTARYQWQVAVHPDSPFVNINNGPIYQGVKTNKLQVIGVSLIQNDFLFRCLLYNVGQCIAPGDTSAIAILNVVPLASVNNINKHASTIVYPNPVSGNELYIKTGLSSIADKYSIYDKVGRVVSTGKIDASGITIANVSQLATGVYLVELWDKDDKKISTSKFTKQ